MGSDDFDDDGEPIDWATVEWCAIVIIACFSIAVIVGVLS